MKMERRHTDNNNNNMQQEQPPTPPQGLTQPKGGSGIPTHDPDDLSDESSSDDDDDDLGLEGVLVRNPDASSSSSSSEDENEESDGGSQDDNNEDSNSDDDSKCDKEMNGTAESKASSKLESSPPKKKSTTTKRRASPSPNPPQNAHQKKQKKPKKSKAKAKKKKSSSDNDDDDEDLVQVDFTFHDMDEKFYDGLKALLHNSGTVYQPHAGNWADIMVDNVSVGTLLSTDGDVEGNVYGFASVLNVHTTYRESPAVQHLQDVCCKGCPPEHRDAFRAVWTKEKEGKGSGPTGVLLHGRMINLPLEITLTLHQQLLLDLDWAVQHAEGGPDERQSLDFATIVRVAPCQLEGGGGDRSSAVVHRYFDDEFFHDRAHLSFVTDAPKSYSKEQPQKLQISVLTASAFRQAVQDLERMVGGGSRA